MSNSGVNYSGLPESVLVRASQSGDQRAFSEIVFRRANWLRGLMTRMCGNISEGEDIAQEAFLKAWQQLHTLQDAGAFGSWIRKLALRLFIDGRRKAALDIDLEVTPDSLRDNRSTPESAASAQIDLERALLLLSEMERVCIILNFGEGLSQAEIAATLGMPIGTVKSHISRGTKKLRQKLGEGYG